MDRGKFIRKLSKYARRNKLEFYVEKSSGKGSHYLFEMNKKFSTIQMQLNPNRIEPVCKQLGIKKGDLDQL